MRVEFIQTIMHVVYSFLDFTGTKLHSIVIIGFAVGAYLFRQNTVMSNRVGQERLLIKRYSF